MRKSIHTCKWQGFWILQNAVPSSLAHKVTHCFCFSLPFIASSPRGSNYASITNVLQDYDSNPEPLT